MASIRHQSVVSEEELLVRLRALISSLPETSEKLSHGSPTWWGGKKTFATLHSGGYDDGRPAVWFLAPEGAQEVLVEANPERFYRPKYLAHRGWVGMRLVGEVDWAEVDQHLRAGYRMVAPKRALKQLDEEG